MWQRACRDRPMRTFDNRSRLKIVEDLQQIKADGATPFGYPDPASTHLLYDSALEDV